jgi:hypothetical protein
MPKGRCKDGKVPNQLRRFWQHYRGAQGVVRELLTIALCVGLGSLVMPCLIYATGRLVLGPYAHGNLFAMWRDFLAALTAGSFAAWSIVVGPYLLLWLFRGGRRLLHN